MTIVAHDIGPVGGMERVLVELILGLRRRGHRVNVIARTCRLPQPAGVTFHRVRAPRRPFLVAYPWFLVAGSVAVRKSRRGLLQSTGAIVLNRVDVMAVHYCHQVGPAAPSRSSWPFRAHNRLVRHLKRLGERLCFRISRDAAFVCVSRGVADELRRHFPELASRVTVIHNGVDVERFAPGARRAQARALRARLGIEDGRLVAVLVGSEWERKGLAFAIEALARCGGWDLLVAGSGDRARYRRLADALGVGDAVHWLGVSSDVALLYEAADAFVLPSSYETFSLVTFEAAASGLPILATPVSGVRELLVDGRNGLLIERDRDRIAACLALLTGDPRLRRRLGEAARRSALGYGWERTVAGHGELYARLRAGGGRSP